MQTTSANEQVNYQAAGETIQAAYRLVSARYRRDDEIEVTTPNHLRVHANLQSLCKSFPRPIRVLDVGCGTGRHFHCLTNARELVGLDVTEEMLRAAEHPVLEERISVPQIRLLQRNVYFTDFPAGSFDLIYSLGMFGNACPVTTELCNRFHAWLATGGRLYFDTIDVAGLPFLSRLRRLARKSIYPLLSPRWRQVLDARAARHPFFGYTRRELQSLMRNSRFGQFDVQSHVCRSPLWSGRHLECIASKAPQQTD